MRPVIFSELFPWRVSCRWPALICRSAGHALSVTCMDGLGLGECIGDALARVAAVLLFVFNTTILLSIVQYSCICEKRKTKRIASHHSTSQVHYFRTSLDHRNIQPTNHSAYPPFTLLPLPLHILVGDRFALHSPHKEVNAADHCLFLRMQNALSHHTASFFACLLSARLLTTKGLPWPCIHASPFSAFPSFSGREFTVSVSSPHSS